MKKGQILNTKISKRGTNRNTGMNRGARDSQVSFENREFGPVKKKHYGKDVEIVKSVGPSGESGFDIKGIKAKGKPYRK